MSREGSIDRKTLELIGMCLLSVQQAEHAISSAVESILDRPDLMLTEQSEFERKQALGDFLKRLKRRVKVEYGLKERLFRFLEMRNTFVHNLSEVPGWDLNTEEGRKVARMFLAELAVTAIAITLLFTTLFSVSAKDEYGKDLFTQEEKREHEMIELMEKHFGATARKILAGRYRGPALVRPSKDHSK
jgi:hypothetical protein